MQLERYSGVSLGDEDLPSAQTVFVVDSIVTLKGSVIISLSPVF